METVGSFNDMVVLSLQYQGFPTQQPVQQHTEGPTYEVGDEPCSTHSERQRHLPTFQLMAGERPFLFLLSFFFINVISSCLVSGLLPSHAMESHVSRATTQNQRSDACQPRGTTHSLTSSACWINPQACSETCAYCTNSWEIWPCTSVSLRMAVLMVEWEALYVYFSWVFGRKKKAPEAASSDPPWLSDLETSQAALWILSSQIWFTVILSFFFFFF